MNTCAQRLASRLVGVPAAQLERTHPPDTPLRLLGTTPRRLARMLTAYGRPSVVRHGSGPFPGDAVCVDLRPLQGGLPRLHWMLVGARTDDRIELDGRWYANDAFARAWACRASPFAMHRRACVGLVTTAPRDAPRTVTLGTSWETRGKAISLPRFDGHS